MLSFDELVFIKKAKVMFKVPQCISPIYIAEMFQIKGCDSEETMTLRSDSNENLKHQSLNEICLKTKTKSYSGALILNSILVKYKMPTRLVL